MWLALLFLCTCAVAKSTNVIVIGSGPSGIAAAAKLHENGVNVTVLEAENRIGGRIYSVHFGDATVDLGAENCHGEKDNVVYEMVKDLGLLTSYVFDVKLFASDREHVDDKLGLELLELFDEIYTTGNYSVDEGVTLGEHFIKKYNNSVYHRYGNNKQKLNFAINALELMHHFVLGSEGAFSWFEPSAKNDYKESEGDQALIWKGMGYKIVLDIIMKKYPKVDTKFALDEKIKLNKEVVNILVNNKGGATVVCSNGEQFKSDHVVFTPSLGVLKNYHQTLFTPPLSEIKVKAIKEHGFEGVLKIMLHFHEIWWQDNFNGFSFVWTQFDKEKLIANDTSKKFWMLDFLGVFPVNNNTKVLNAWFTGKSIPDIENIPDNILIDGLDFVLNKFLGHKYNITKPDQIFRAKWYGNPHFKGTYSFETIESRKMKNPTSHMALAEPIYVNNVPTLLFAGEATHPYHYATVHGAIETGRREADRIINFINKKL